MTKSRFVVGKKYPFITHTTKCMENGKTFNSYSFDDNDHFKTVDTKLVMLECVSEHDVPIEYSDNMAKGYIFVDADGVEYRNQYPTASYGQMSNNADYMALGFVKDKDGNDDLIHYYGLKQAIASLERVKRSQPLSYKDSMKALFDEMLTFIKENELKLKYSVFVEDFLDLNRFSIVDAKEPQGVNDELGLFSNEQIEIKVVWVLGCEKKNISSVQWFHTEKAAKEIFDSKKALSDKDKGNYYLFPYVVTANQTSEGITNQALDFFHNVDKSKVLPTLKSVESA